MEGLALSAFLAWADDHHQAVHFPAMGMPQMLQWCKPQMVEPPLVNVAATMVSESRKHTPEQKSIHTRKSASTVKEKLTCRGPMA